MATDLLYGPSELCEDARDAPELTVLGDVGGDEELHQGSPAVQDLGEETVKYGVEIILMASFIINPFQISMNFLLQSNLC